MTFVCQIGIYSEVGLLLKNSQGDNKSVENLFEMNVCGRFIVERKNKENRFTYESKIFSVYSCTVFLYQVKSHNDE